MVYVPASTVSSTDSTPESSSVVVKVMPAGRGSGSVAPSDTTAPSESVASMAAEPASPVSRSKVAGVEVTVGGAFSPLARNA